MSQKITLTVNNIGCASCAKKIEDALSKKDGVIKVDINLSSKNVLLEYDENKVSVKDMILIIEKTGYNVEK